ncbi:MAG: hypothetical protein ACI7YS_09550 [Flavobacterium sp.]
MNDEIQYIISGENSVRHGAAIRAIISYLRGGQETSEVDKGEKQLKKQEEKKLREYITKQGLWVCDIDLDNYISEGAEQKVYLKDGKNVLKLNDAIYYSSWTDYMINLLLNNYFFPDTAYELLGFFESDKTLYALVEQPFVKATEKTDLAHVKEFMLANGFENIRNNDYYNPKLGIILEDLHDENVLTRNELLYFIDTVFYVKY